MASDDTPLHATEETIGSVTTVIHGLSRPGRIDSKTQEKLQVTLRAHKETYSNVVGPSVQPALQYNVGSLKKHIRIADAYKRRKAVETRMRLFYEENGEARPVHDDEVDMEAYRDSLLRHALQNEEWALCATLKQSGFRAEAVAAVAKLEQWKWDDAMRFITSSPHVLNNLLQSPGVPLLDRLPAATSAPASVSAGPIAAASRAASSQGGVVAGAAADAVAVPSRPGSRASGSAPAVGQTSGPCGTQPIATDSAHGPQAGSRDAGPQAIDFASDAADCEYAEVPWAVALGMGMADVPQSPKRTLGGSVEAPTAKQQCLVASSGASAGPSQLSASLDVQPPVSGAVGACAAADAMDDVKRAFCTRCGEFNCERHGNSFQYTGDASGSAGGGLHDGEPLKDFEAHAKQWTAPCGPGCFRLSAAAPSSQTPGNWSAVESQTLEAWIEDMGPHACLLAPLVADRACSEVHSWLISQGLLGSEEGVGINAEKDKPSLDLEALAAPARRRRKRNVASAPVTQAGTVHRRNAPAFLSRRRHDPQQPWPEYTPCDCDPAKGCSGSCPCAASKNYCERFCGCGGACGNVHRGCKCSGSCNTSTCPCYDDARECDPQKCVSCRKTAHGLAEEGDRICSNMNLRLGSKRPLAMGISGIAGWGLFAMEDIARGDFIGEYVGELLSQEECERRGQVYDIINSSYLFQLNTEWAIDARKAGSKLRFANHQVDTNTYARVMMVSGDHHVGMYAKTDMKAGEELKYDYGYHTGDGFCPRWGDISHQPAKHNGDSSKERGDSQ